MGRVFSAIGWFIVGIMTAIICWYGILLSALGDDETLFGWFALGVLIGAGVALYAFFTAITPKGFIPGILLRGLNLIGKIIPLRITWKKREE